MFHHLIELDKDVTGLSDHQKNLVKFFKEGKSDSDIQKEMGIVQFIDHSESPLLLLKKKERQAKVFLTLMELLNDWEKKRRRYLCNKYCAWKKSALTASVMKEREKILAKNFPRGFKRTSSYFSSC